MDIIESSSEEIHIVDNLERAHRDNINKIYNTQPINLELLNHLEDNMCKQANQQYDIAIYSLEILLRIKERELKYFETYSTPDNYYRDMYLNRQAEINSLKETKTRLENIKDLYN